MEIDVIVKLISTLGFPTMATIVLAVFVSKILTKINEQNQKHMEELGNEAKEREDKLYEQIKECTAINGQFAQIIAKYDVKLD